jgi:2-iminoacetate synthase ThiH
MRDVADVKSEIDAVALFTRNGIRLPDIPKVVYAVAQDWDGRRIFLQDGDALVYPLPKLGEVLKYLNEKLPGVERIGTYATPQDILRRSEDELKELRQLNLGIFYTGLETGDEELLQKVGKRVSPHEVIEAGRRVKKAGISFSATVILGLGGIEGSQKHVFETARVLTEIDPDYVGALTLTLVPGTPLHEQWERNKFHPISPFQSLQELKSIIENSSFTDCFFSSMHASNYFPVRGRLPQDKKRMLSELGTLLAARDPSLLRPEFLRGL